MKRKREEEMTPFKQYYFVFNDEDYDGYYFEFKARDENEIIEWIAKILQYEKAELEDIEGDVDIAYLLDEYEPDEKETPIYDFETLKSKLKEKSSDGIINFINEKEFNHCKLAIISDRDNIFETLLKIGININKKEINN